ncbi:MAG TPA: site-specific DNA-methyltransferase [Acidimicrobiales bacterium]|nr:site-specific DNA-methyltransferase [Acidimicrobiales bacterium]
MAGRKATATSSFGVGKRESHDASAFYARFEAPVVSGDEAVHPEKAIDRILCGDSRRMAEVPDASVALVVTSPPYFAGKDYETELGKGAVPKDYLDFLRMLEDVFAECVRTLEPGGRIAVNVANLGRKPYRSLAADVTSILQDRLRLLLRGEVVWAKARGAGGSCAWGSFRSPSNPVLRDLTERVVVASKGRFDRAITRKDRARLGLPHVATVTADEFMEATTDVWEIPSERASRVGHPAPFPVELPERLIHLHTYVGDLVLDPFMGAGTTAVAAARAGRHYVGYDTDPDYVTAAASRVAGVGVQPAGAGEAAVDAAQAALEATGWRDVTRPRGTRDLVATDRAGRRWRVLVGGGRTVARPGLRRLEEAWRVISAASAAGASGVPVVVITPALPPPSSPAHPVLEALTGAGRPVAAVIELDSPAAGSTLRDLAGGGT